MTAQDRAAFFARPMEIGDIEPVYHWLQDLEDLSLFDRTITIPPGLDALRETWRSELAGGKAATAFWFAVETTSRAVVGIGGLQSINYAHGDATIPILVAKAQRGGGLGLRIACLLLDVAFDRLRLRRVTTYFRADNERTARLIRRAGFREEGRLREAWMANGCYVDSVVVGILKEEWHARRDSLRHELGHEISLVFGRGGSEQPSRTPPAGNSVPIGSG